MKRVILGLKISRSASREERLAYGRARRALIRANPELMARLRATQAAYRKRYRARLRARHAKWRAENPERKKKISNAYLARHRERLNAKQREKNKDPARIAYIQDYARQHRAKNRSVYVSYAQKRRSLAVGAPGSHTAAEWEAKVAACGGSCGYCGEVRKLVRDHDIPLSRGGSNDISNIVPACSPCNSQKGTLTGAEFRARKEAA